MTDPLARARALARLLDSAVRVPGTGIRFGLDPVLGLVPGLGDVAGAVLSGYLVLLAARTGATRTTILRMLANVAVDVVGGALPLLGDAFDVAWKSNSRNLALLERAVGRSATERIGAPAAGRIVVGTALLGLAALMAAAVVLAVLVVRAVAHHL